MTDPNLLTPSGHVEDAAAYLLDAERVLLFTADYFTPVVDDPYVFGQIAAANAFSDVYAMGGRPKLALNLMSFPSRKHRIDEMLQIMKGGSDKAVEAGCLIVGGHTVDDAEPKYGLAVIGEARVESLLRKGGAKPGDRIALTKPLGTGILATAYKAGDLSESEYAPAVESMRSLSAVAAECALESGLHGATDVTGFGLLGHLLEMCREAEVGAEIRFSSLPFFDGVERQALEQNVPGGTYANRDLVIPHVGSPPGFQDHHLLMAADAQTSGGLLLAVPPRASERFEEACRSRSQRFWWIGTFRSAPCRIQIVP